ncbi:PilC/PilY family type IV pilus protein [Kangiella taiwanensis]|uniref:PilY1 beta-propeller domain-containing protein n=1 Tax=Kangiella taiwanensis TaxID=1079179 RepID=A0ABP8I0I6_9GAMM|nr:PilC/PilY family type IV pilus protein [Kangiella taiwanensis]
MNIFMKKLKVAGGSIAISLALGLGLSSAPNISYADDTEIFFGEAKTANLMLVLDESGSMSFKDSDSAADEVLVNYWQQNKTEKVENVRARLVGVPEDKARFATLQAYTNDGWTDYVPYNTQFRDRLSGWDLTRAYRDVYYRWIYKDNRITRLKEALYQFLTSEKTKDNNQIGILTYSGGRTPQTKVIQEIRRLDKTTAGKTHRQHLIDSLDQIQPHFGTPTAEGYYQATQYLGGAYTQNGPALPSPILDGACGYNSSIVLLTDGLPTVFDEGTYDDIDKVVDTCDASESGTQNGTNNGKQCTEKLSAYYFINDVKSNFPGSTVQTSTVAFALNDKVATDFLKNTASTVNGKKLFFEPTNVESLVRSFDESLNAIQDTTSFVAPSIPLSQSNRLRHSNNLYMGMFKPAARESWFGNLKKYQLSDGRIIDKDGNLAVNTETGTFIEESKSFWGDVEDGNKVEAGGALPYISVSAEPVVYTNLTSNNLDQLTDDFINDYIAKHALKIDFQDRLFGENRTTAVPDILSDQLKNYYQWIKHRVTQLDGQDINRFGDVLHSKPEILEYDDGSSTAFVATNQGYIHAIDIATGKERWAFFPRQMMKNVPEWYANAAVDHETDFREYGIDGTITIHTEVENGVKKHYLYVGSRRGGSEVFALDVSNVNSPKMMFTVADDFEFTKAELGYSDEVRTEIPNLGQSWSKPFVVKMHTINGSEKRLVLAGGYDTYYDDRANAINPADNAIKGDGIYSVPYKGSASYSTIASESDIYNSFAGDLTFIDLDNDAVVDHIYAADVGGKIYRIDFKKNSSASKVELFADVYDGTVDGPYRFYSKPDVAFAIYNGIPFAVVNLGSGHRSNPKATATSDRYYAFYDFEISEHEKDDDFDPLKASSLLDVTNTTTDPDTGEVSFASVSDIFEEGNQKKGWYFNLQPAEKVLSSSTTLDFTTLFTTYIPGPPGCGVTSGVNRLYGVNLLDGKPDVDNFAVGDIANIQDRYTNVKYVGIAPGATVLFPEDTDAALLVGTQTVCSGDDCDFFRKNARTIKWKQKE